MINIQSNENNQLLFSSINELLIEYQAKNSSLLFSSKLNTTEISIQNCYQTKTIIKRQVKEKLRSGKKFFVKFFSK